MRQSLGSAGHFDACTSKAMRVVGLESEALGGRETLGQVQGRNFIFLGHRFGRLPQTSLCLPHYSSQPPVLARKCWELEPALTRRQVVLSSKISFRHTLYPSEPAESRRDLQLHPPKLRCCCLNLVFQPPFPPERTCPKTTFPGLAHHKVLPRFRPRWWAYHTTTLGWKTVCLLRRSLLAFELHRSDIPLVSKRRPVEQGASIGTHRVLWMRIGAH